MRKILSACPQILRRALAAVAVFGITITAQASAASVADPFNYLDAFSL